VRLGAAFLPGRAQDHPNSPDKQLQLEALHGFEDIAWWPRGQSEIAIASGESQIAVDMGEKRDKMLLRFREAATSQNDLESRGARFGQSTTRARSTCCSGSAGTIGCSADAAPGYKAARQFAATNRLRICAAGR
jgi:hypothetical protein